MLLAAAGWSWRCRARAGAAFPTALAFTIAFVTTAATVATTATTVITAGRRSGRGRGGAAIACQGGEHIERAGDQLVHTKHLLGGGIVALEAFEARVSAAQEGARNERRAARSGWR